MHIHKPEFDELFNWETLYSIAPKDIKWGLTYAFDVTKDEWNKVYDGGWDKKLPINQDFVYYSVMKMIKDNIPFENTDLYRVFAKKISNGTTCYNCKTPKEFLVRGEKILNLYKKISKEGYKTQKQLQKEGYPVAQVFNQLIDEPGVCIDRDGRYLYHNGNHRLPIFYILDIPKISLTVNARHKEWAEFILFVKKINKKIWGDENKIYHPVDHVDFSNMNPEWSDYRAKLIKQHIDSDYKSVLDIGALWGYYSSELEKIGKSCTAVEMNGDFVKIMTKLRDSKDQKFNIYYGDIFTLPTKKYDVVLALNIFHHFLKKEQTYKKLKWFLQCLDMKEMYFQSHRTEESQMQNAYVNFSNTEFINFIINNSCLINFEEIGKENGRTIYKLWR